MMSSDVGGATLVGTVRRGVAKSSTSLRDSDMPWASATFGGSRTCATGMGEVSAWDRPRNYVSRCVECSFVSNVLNPLLVIMYYVGSM